QALSRNYTVVHSGQLLRVDGTDAAALGLEAETLDIRALEDDSTNDSQAWQAQATVFHREIPVDPVGQGAIWACIVNQETGNVEISMTLTAPSCGMGPVLVGDVEYRVRRVPNVRSVTVELVFDPPWSRDMMSEEAQLETGMFF